MTRPDTGNRIVWAALSAAGILLLSLVSVLISGSAARVQDLQARVAKHGERITRTESRGDAQESRTNDVTNRVAALEKELDRMKNPRPWDRPARGR